MEKKSLFSIGAGVLLILAAVLSFLQGALTFSSIMYPYFEKAQISFRAFKRPDFMDIYMARSMNFATWVNIGLLGLTGVILLVKAFMPDLIPDIVLGGIFGLLALFALISLFREFINMFRNDQNMLYGIRHDFGYYIGYLINLFASLLMLIAWGGMAAIVLLKDSFGQFFFVPALAAAVNAVIVFFINLGLTRALGIWTGSIVWTFGASLVFLIMDFVLVGALFAVGMAVQDK